MVGIVAFGTYIPYYRLQRQKLGEAYGERGMGGEKAVANFDEDSVSLAVGAALACLDRLDPRQVDGIYFTTTTPSYAEKQAATTIATALDLRKNVRVADVTGSLRASASALLAAVDAVRAGAATGTSGAGAASGEGTGAGRVLVAAADCRLGAPQGAHEQLFGDAAAALLVGTGEDVMARMVAAASHAQEQIGVWRERGDGVVQAWEERFVQEVYLASVMASVTEVLAGSGLQSADFSRVVMTGPSPRAQLAAAGKLGFGKEQLADLLVDTVGMAGTAHGPILLAAALERAKPGDRILYVSCGEGSDAIVFEVTEAIGRLSGQRRLQDQLQTKNNNLKYTDYLKWKGLLATEPPRRPETPRPSVTAMQRNYQQNLGLYGSKCLACGTPQFPKQRVCVQCQAKDRMEDCRFYGKAARVATYTIDYLAASPAPPTVVAVADFAGGGRMICEVTDCDPAEMWIGMELEMTFRRLYQAGGIHNYFWKAKPKRNRETGEIAHGQQRNH